MLQIIIDIVIGILVAFGVGIHLYRNGGNNEAFDYIPAFAAGVFWPISIVLFAMYKCLDVFKDMCIEIGKRLDSAEEAKKVRQLMK